ncbi:MAG: lytic transglycosylase domain-containing protein [Proteobacteria bacterium]|nr:lytic transglycosylase domain-containing protein [Pseudomonadota bacterium]
MGASNELDQVIEFWLEYWQSQGLEFPPGMNALVVKALIAVESGFNASRVAGPTGGRGLMQMLKGSIRTLRGVKDKYGYREIKNQCMVISPDEVLNPVINIAAGTRWLAHKYALIRALPAKTLFNTLKNYNQNNEEGEEYARRVLDLYNKSK